MLPKFCVGLISLFAATSLSAADLLPLRNGIFVPVGTACKGASNADVVNYWGGKSAIGVAQASCTIKSVKHAGTRYTYTDVCQDIASGDKIEGDAPTMLAIASPTSFTMNKIAYRYCGPKPQF